MAPLFVFGKDLAECIRQRDLAFDALDFIVVVVVVVVVADLGPDLDDPSLEVHAVPREMQGFTFARSRLAQEENQRKERRSHPHARLVKALQFVQRPKPDLALLRPDREVRDRRLGTRDLELVGVRQDRRKDG
ncbi:MAG: hypothetical protein ABSF69_27590 [Polyangiaceae bacterium]